LKRIFLFLALISSQLNFNTIVRLPDAKVLCERFRAERLDEFVRKTKIIDKLAGQQKDVQDILFVVESELDSNFENIRNPMLIEMMDMRKNKIFQILLKDFPEALKELSELQIKLSV